GCATPRSSGFLDRTSGSIVIPARSAILPPGSKQEDRMDRRQLLKCALGSGLAAFAPAAWTQGKYPDKPITFVVPFAAGGGGDVVARVIAKGLAERTGNPVVVENKAGAGRNIGAAYVLKSPPNGYTLLNMSS